jgi:hypothetical protein
MKIYIVWETYEGKWEGDDRILRVLLDEDVAKEFCNECNDSPDVLSGKFSYWYEEWEAV